MADLTGYGLAEATWGEADAPLGPFVASPADARGRGLALTVARDGTPVDLTGLTVALLWRHREARLRGTADFELSAPQLGACRIHWPRAMAAHEGTVDAQVAIIEEDGSVMSSLPFVVDVVMALDGGPEDEEGAVASLLAAAADARSAAAEIRAAAARGDFDGEDGAPGDDGQDGYSPTVTVEQTEAGATVTVVDEHGTTTAEIPRGAKGDKGDDGTSCTHSWSGSVLTVTSASGTSSADLRGPKGDDGDPAERPQKIHLIDEYVMYGGGSSFDGEKGAFAVGDFTIDIENVLATVADIEEGDGGTDTVKLEPVEALGVGRLIASEEIEVEPGDLPTETYGVMGTMMRAGDLVLSTDTGCLAKVHEVSGVGRGYGHSWVRLKGLCYLATRGYVDAAVATAIAALDDLSEVEF
ncbi:BppU family phage baseplate upper protein [Collinsella ihumii]|uniref:BppU family phage baseplate upper protein n=1 Tax=Collinsella ihumii TaxID=1720204 RepID=UPI0025AA7641|nr:BppU family phage baseplate upper protein [Collinsella ihumii]MDN0056363.1 BppU family phage baseplate upper protein [Collinsella ihumii]